ncbi:MAG: tetratricopeptide repeat protein [Spirochaetaceae bacterium]|nr:tetratricopeptide repeat protein [Spirochaetaceae bacterium]RKX76885.1 MAG: hypothetical protein DRP49_02770 [Spirochaetota bacterium]RKX90470.1 MAG: hypothetical protein DRP70_00650 [Spirochaetota bacterium]RKX93850.1 MAG: hypothetical protein DRZ90_12425 [Spirochaetota bacterium]
MITEAKRKAIKLFARGRDFYKKRDFQEALKYFSAAYKTDPTDEPSNVFIARCQEYIDNPPDEGWDGVYGMKSK